MPYYQEFVKQNAILVDRLEMKSKEFKSTKHVGIWEIILNPHTDLLALSIKGLEF